MTATIMRPALRYFGGKWRLGPWIISHFPAHRCYVEPFAGGASVLLQKVPAAAEVLNDLDGTVVNFWRVLRERTEEFLHAVELTPFSRAEVDAAYEPASDPLESARRFYIRSWQSRGGPRAQWRTGWRFARRPRHNDTDPLDIWHQTDHLWDIAARLKGAQIECDDALAVIRRFDSPCTLFYVDPPYLASVRSERWAEKAYAHEMTDAQHIALAELLRSIKGMAIVSGYQGPLYKDLYAGWPMAANRTVTDAATERTEVLWLSPNIAQQQGRLAL